MVRNYRSGAGRKKPRRSGARDHPRGVDHFWFCFSVFFGLIFSAGAGGRPTGRHGRRFLFLGGLHVRRDDHRVRLAMGDDLDAGAELDVADVQRLALGHLAEVDGDELGQLRGQALDVELVDDVVDDAGVGLHRRRVLLVDVVQRHLLRDLGRGIDALEVDVQHDRPERMHLVVAQQHLLGLAGELHVEQRRVERFLLQREEEGVVVELDDGRRAGSVDDARDLLRIAQAAARSGPLLRALESGEFHDRLQR